MNTRIARIMNPSNHPPQQGITMTGFAFQISSDDVENVLREHAHRVANANGQSFEQMAEDLIDQLDHQRIEKAALDASTDLMEQTNAAYGEIKDSLVEMGVLKA